MTVVALCSAKGSPGTTMTAQALSLVWRTRCVLADLDPAGGDLMWRCRTPAGEPLDPDRGLLSLAAATRRGARQATLADHLQDVAGGGRVLVGAASQTQLSGLGNAWSQLPEVFAQHEDDVLADCGRIAPGTPSLAVVQRADVVCFVVRPDLEGIGHLRERLRSLSGSLLGSRVADAPPRVGVVVVTGHRDGRSVPDLQQLLDSEGLPVRALGLVAHDPRAAAVLSSTRVGGVRRSVLARSAVAVAERLAALAEAARPRPTGATSRPDDRMSGWSHGGRW